MKKLLFIILLATTVKLSAQLQLTTQPNGIVDVAYGNNYALFDPQGATEVYVYLWVDPNQTRPVVSMTYNDDWNNASGLVVLTYSATEDKFLGQIDFNTHNFDGEGVLPQGTQVGNFNFILRNQAGNSQTGNLLGSDYGFFATTTVAIYDYNAEKNSYYANGFLHLNPGLDANQINIYNLSGQLLTSFNTKKTNINLSYLTKQTLIIVVRNKNKYFIKKIQL